MTETASLSWEAAVRRFRMDPSNDLAVRQNYFDLPIAAAATRYARSSEFGAITRLLGSCSGRAVDVGGGRGFTAFALACRGWDVTVAEPDASNDVGIGATRELPRSTRGRVTAVCAAGEQLPFASHSVDLVFGRQVLHHFGDLDRGLAEAHRVLRRGGRALFVREHVVDDDEQLAAFLANHPLHASYGGENAYPLQRYTESFSSAGFRLIRVVGPLDSMVNFYPGSEARRIARIGRQLVRARAWTSVIDRRRREAVVAHGMREPGRLYSFLAEPC